MILGVEICGDVFGVPAQVVLEQEFRSANILSYVLAAADTHSLELGEGLAIVLLPHHDLVVPPLPVRRFCDERGSRVLLPYVLHTLAILALERQVRADGVTHGRGTAHV